MSSENRTSSADGSAGAQRVRLLDWLQVYGTHHADLRRGFAGWLQLHTTDANALIEISTNDQAGRPLTAARLAGRLRLSPAATTALLNRLERAGYITRTREHLDGRVVLLRAGQATHDLAEQFFAPVAARLDDVLARYPREQLHQLENLLRDLSRTLGDILADPPKPLARDEA